MSPTRPTRDCWPRAWPRWPKAVERLKAGGLAPRVKTRDRTPLVRRHARSIGANLRRRTEEAKGEVMAINARLARIASDAIREARRVAVNARRKLRQLGRAAPARLEAEAKDLEVTAQRVARIAGQTRQRLAGNVPDGSTRLVSLHDPDARPIRKGRLGKPVEFGYKAQVVDNEDGIVVDHAVFIGNPPDAPMLAPAIQGISQRANVVGESLSELGVRQVVLPTKGIPSAARRAVENQEPFQELVRWRTGSEGRISCLKRDFGWNRTRIDGLEGAKTWCGHGVFNHNLVKIATLVSSQGWRATSGQP
jgi:transposase, IS5 family